MHNENRADLIGNLGADPELKYTSTNKAVANLSVATNERWTDKDGSEHDHTEWHRVTVWGVQAERAGKYLKKGSFVRIVGKLRTESWEDRDGIKRYTTKIVAHTVGYLDRKPDDSRAEEGPPPPEADAPPPADADIPF